MAKSNWLKVQNSADHAEIAITGYIGEHFYDESGICEKEFTDALNSIPVNVPIVIGINSQGGSIKDGLGIFNAIKRRCENITARIDGYAVSTASWIPLAASKVISPKGSVWMIHNSWMMAMGDKTEMEKAAKSLEVHDETISNIISEETGIDKEKVRKMMADETWFNGDQAVEFGFADSVTEENPALNALDGETLKFARNIPKNILKAAGNAGHTQPEANQPVTPPASFSVGTPPQNDNQNQTKGKNMADNNPAVPAAIDFKPVLDRLDALENKLNSAPPGAAPVKPQVVVIGNADDKLAEMNDTIVVNGIEVANVAKIRHIQNAWNDIITARAKKAGLPVNDNTVSATLTTSLLSMKVIENLQNRLAPIGALFTQVEQDPVKPMATVVIPNITAGPTVQTDPTDWESGNSTVGALSVTMHEYSASYHITNAQLQGGTQIGWLAGIAARNLADKILDVIAANLTAANYTNTAVVAAAANFDAATLRSIWASAKDFSSRNLVIDGGHWAQLIPSNTQGFGLNQGSPVYGFDGIWYSNRWSAADSDVVGFVASPEAMGIVSGLPIAPAGAGGSGLSIGSVTVPGVNITVQTSSWFKPGTRVQWAALDLMLGTVKGDGSALTLIKSA